VLALTGRQPNRAGKIHCPFHDDRTPSLQIYRHDWYCYGACRTGGSIYDFAALLYGLRARGREFIELRQRLADELHLAAPSTASTPPPAASREIATARGRRR
jgi:DNA primase